jgi:histidine triad (HIT) family protein
MNVDQSDTILEVMQELYYLIIPKKHLINLTELTPDDAQLASSMLLLAHKMSNQLGDVSFRFVINNGKEAGQIVLHLHAHFLSGRITAPF